MSDPSNNGVPPDRATVERALRVARRECAQPAESYDPGNDYWRGAIEALRWSLNQRGTAPVSELTDVADLDVPPRSIVRREALHTHDVMRGDRRRTDGVSMGYLAGAENTLMWVAGGRGFAAPLDVGWLRENYGIE